MGEVIRWPTSSAGSGAAGAGAGAAGAAGAATTTGAAATAAGAAAATPLTMRTVPSDSAISNSEILDSETKSIRVLSLRKSTENLAFAVINGFSVADASRCRFLVHGTQVCELGEF